MLGDECPAAKPVAHLCAFFTEDKAEGSHVRSQGIFGGTNVIDIFGDRIFHAAIEVVAVINPRPTVIRTDRHIGEIIRHQVRTEHVAFVDGGP